MNTKCVIGSDCDYCYECVELCPSSALYADDEDEIHYNANDCQYCEVCMDICPSKSIMIVLVDEEE